MKWFKHTSDAHKNLKTGSVIAEHGIEGYGLWWLCVELIASQGEQYALGADQNWKRWLMRESGLSKEKIDGLLAFFADERLIDSEALSEARLYIPKLAEYCDDYESRSVRTKSKSVRTISDKVPLEEKRREENRKEDKEYVHIKYLLEIPSSDLKEMSAKYEASPKQIIGKGEELKNYCDAKGKTYKNYRAFLENALNRDFGRRTPKVTWSPEPKPVLDADEQARVDALKKQISEQMHLKTQETC